MKRKRALPWTLLALTAGSGACGWFAREEGDRLSISGNIELTVVQIAFKMPGHLLELRVREGTRVRKGEVIATLDTEQLVRQREREEASLAAAVSVSAQLRKSIEHQQASLSAETDLRRAELRQAEVRLEELQSGSREQEILQAAAAVDQARSQQEQATSDWKRAQTLRANDDISAAQFDQYRARFQGSSAALKQAEERLSLVREGPRKEKVAAAQALVTRAQALLRVAEAGRFELERRQQELVMRRAEIDRARAQIAIIDSQLKDAVAVSPIDGIILVKSAEPGEILAAGTSVVTVGDLDRPWLRGYIREQDLGRVKLGSAARIVTDTYPDKVYSGTVSFIASEAEFTPRQIQTAEERVKLVYRIKIDVENPQQELKANMPADATILLTGQ